MSIYISSYLSPNNHSSQYVCSSTLSLWLSLFYFFSRTPLVRGCWGKNKICLFYLMVMYFGCVVVPLTYGSKLVLSLFYFFRPTPLVRERLKKLVMGLSQHCQRHDAAPYITPDLLTWLRAHKQKHRQSTNQKPKAQHSQRQQRHI